MQRKGYATYGAGAVWTPSPRTSLTANFDERSFGRTHNLSFEHRTALTTWRISDSRSVSTVNGENGAGSRGTAYNLLFAQFASIEPDPVKRTDLVNSALLRSGINPTAGSDRHLISCTGARQPDRVAATMGRQAVRTPAIDAVATEEPG